MSPTPNLRPSKIKFPFNLNSEVLIEQLLIYDYKFHTKADQNILIHVHYPV